MGRPKGEPIDFPCFDEPTRTERPLVAAIKADRENWPAIYSEMCKVDKDMLLEDPDYCNRHRNPSLTQFYIECGAMASMRISMLRKFDRAGKFYEKCLSRFPDLPPISDPSVAKLSPDTLILICRIEEFINMGAPDNPLDVEWLVHRLVSDVVEGHGLARKQLNAWLSSLQDAAIYGRLDSAVTEFIMSLDPRRLTSSKLVYNVAEQARCLESFVKGKLNSGEWLDAAYAECDALPGEADVRFLSGAIEVVSGPFRLDKKSLPHDFAVIDARRDQMIVHAVEVKVKAAHIEKALRLTNAEKNAAGVDFYWFATEGEVPSALVSHLKSRGIGLLLREDDGLRIVLPPERCTPADNVRSDLLSSLLLKIIRKPKKPFDKRSCFEYAVVSLKD